MQVEDPRRLADEVIVDREDLRSTGLQRVDDGIDLATEQDQVPHGHGFAGRHRRESCPGAERQRGLDRNAVARDAQVGARPAKSPDAVRLDLCRPAENLFDGIPVRLDSEGSGSAQREHGRGGENARNRRAS